MKLLKGADCKVTKLKKLSLNFLDIQKGGVVYWELRLL